MANKAVFEGLVIDDRGEPVDVTYVGGEPCYVVDDQGFKRHIPSEEVDIQVLQIMQEAVAGQEEVISEQAAKMLGQEDIFSIAALANQLRQMESRFEDILEVGIPEDGRAYLGMLGFQIVIDVHGEVLEVRQPGMIDPDSE